jgi:[ribosomal protein S18]-alanine N-acetyltransferase
LHVRAATPADLPCLIVLERSCPSAAHWTERQYRQLIDKRSSLTRLVLVAGAADATAAVPTGSDAAGSEQRVGLLGFLIARNVGSEWELENIGVASAARRKGLGTRLLDALVMHAKEAHSESVFLEVRESNTAARRLYETAGFRQTGRRKLYYTDPREDAILYCRTLV